MTKVKKDEKENYSLARQTKEKRERKLQPSKTKVKKDERENHSFVRQK